MWNASSYSDNASSLQIAQNRLIEQLVYHFVLVGDVDNQNPWSRTYWDPYAAAPLSLNIDYRDPWVARTVFRTMQFDEVLARRPFRELPRQQLALFYPLQIRVMRFNSWVVICWCLFKPVDTNGAQLSKNNNSDEYLLNSKTNRNKASKILRLRLWFFFLSKQLITTTGVRSVADVTYNLF